MKGKQIVAIDVGSSNVVIAVGSQMEDGNVDILGIVSEPIGGVVAGRIENNEMASRSIATAKLKIENQLGIKITEAYVGMSGDFIRCVQMEDHVYSQEEGITSRDLGELNRRMQAVKLPDDREIVISMEPLRYMVDDKVVEEPCGAYGHKLSAIYNFVLCDKKMRDRLEGCIKSQGIAAKEFVPNTLIAHLGIATSDEVVDGAVVVNLGAGLTDVTVLQSGKVRYAAAIPMGGQAINDDIRSLSITKYVEDLKIMYGSAIADQCEDDLISFPPKYHIMVKSILRRNLVIAIEARLKETADWVKKEIKEAQCGSRFRPAVLLTGGGSRMKDIEQLFARELGYEDVRVVYPEYDITSESQINHITTPAYSTVVSLLIYGAQRGSCSVAVVPPTPRRETVEVVKPQQVSQPQPQPQPQSEERVVEVKPNKLTVEVGTSATTETTNNDEIEPKPGRVKNFIGKLWQKVNNSLSDDGEHELE